MLGIWLESLGLLIGASSVGVINSFAKAVIVVASGRFAAADGCNALNGCDGGPGDRPGAGSPFVARPPSKFSSISGCSGKRESVLRRVILDL